MLLMERLVAMANVEVAHLALDAARVETTSAADLGEHLRRRLAFDDEPSAAPLEHEPSDHGRRGARLDDRARLLGPGHRHRHKGGCAQPPLVISLAPGENLVGVDAVLACQA